MDKRGIIKYLKERIEYQKKNMARLTATGSRSKYHWVIAELYWTIEEIEREDNIKTKKWKT